MELMCALIDGLLQAFNHTGLCGANWVPSFMVPHSLKTETATPPVWSHLVPRWLNVFQNNYFKNNFENTCYKICSWIYYIFICSTENFKLCFICLIVVYNILKKHCGPRISAQCVSHSMARSIFILKNYDFYWLRKWLGVATYFCFIFKG